MNYLHYDVFTSTRFEGNQLAIFPDARGMSPELMQILAREMNFSESTFVLPAEVSGTDARMRIFTPGGELPMAGHPTIGTTFALADAGVIAPGRDRFVFGLGVGPTPVELTWQGNRLSFAWMDQRLPQVSRPVAAEGDVLRAIGLGPDALAPSLPIEEISCGVPFLYVPLASRAAVDRALPDIGRLQALQSAFPEGQAPVFLFSVEPSGSDVTVYSRMFASGFGIPEDPATGGASGPLGCYLVTHKLVAQSQWLDMVSLQGVKMRRPSRIHMRITTGADGAITRVQVGGQAVRAGAGTID